MNHAIRLEASGKLYLKDPETSELGKKIVRYSVVLIDKLGFEDFTFRKLAQEIGTTEASVYRYFDNKHRLLLYLMNLYWHWMDYLLVFKTFNCKNTRDKIKETLKLLCGEMQEELIAGVSSAALRSIVISESTKVYLYKDVEKDNRNQLFKPYKDLSRRVADLFLEQCPGYKYPRSLATTIIEMSHFMIYFKQHLPSLTDFSPGNDSADDVIAYLWNITQNCLRRKTK